MGHDSGAGARTATQNSADLIGRSKDVGTIEVGKFADIIAVTGNPLQDVSVLQNVGFVMKGGTVYKDKIAATRLWSTEDRTSAGQL